MLRESLSYSMAPRLAFLRLLFRFLPGPNRVGRLRTFRFSMNTDSLYNVGEYSCGLVQGLFFDNRFHVLVVQLIIEQPERYVPVVPILVPVVHCFSMFVCGLKVGILNGCPNRFPSILPGRPLPLAHVGIESEQLHRLSRCSSFQRDSRSMVRGRIR